MNTALYPELTAEEIERIIGPIGPSAFATAPSEASLVVPAVTVALADFGPGAERYTFERVALEISRAALARHWDVAAAAVLDGPEAFHQTLETTLAADLMPMLIRPLADLLVPAEDGDDHRAYREFCRQILADGLAGVAEKYPVMWHRLQVRLPRRIAATVETLQRVRADWPDICSHFGIDLSSRVLSIDLTGDTHGGGRNVSIIRLNDGSAFVYKPRPVDAESSYERLVAALNARFGTRFLTAGVLRRDGYGYVGFIDDTTPHVDFFRTGELAALLYALNARDMHFSNVLSTPDGPVPIDLETLLHPVRHNFRGQIERPTSGHRLLEESVSTIGVLPTIIIREEREGYVDLGYVGGGQSVGASPFRQLRVVEPFSARVRIAWEPTAPAARRTDVGPDASERVRRSCAQMVDGFTACYRLIAGNKTQFRALVDDLFADARLRYVHDPTVQYAQCLRIITGGEPSADPDLAEGLIKRIAMESVGADQRLIESECAQLWDTDIPYFLLQSRSRDVTAMTPQPGTVARLEQSPLEQFHDKLARLDDRDLAQQTRLIRLAFNSKLSDPHTMVDASQVLTAAAQPATEPAGSLDAIALAIGDDLCASMVEDHFLHLPRTWIGPIASTVPDRPWPPGVIGYDLYTGRVGPALVLARLGRHFAQPRFTAAAREVFDPTLRILSERSYVLRSIARAGSGAYNGFAGTLWALATAGSILDEPDYLTAARTALPVLSTGDVRSATWFDMISGGMGTSLVGLTLGDDHATAIAVDACRQALSSDLPGTMEYSGFAHGLSGVLHFAARTHAATGSRDAADLARAVTAQLQSAFAHPGGGYFTNRSGARNLSDSWCNGTGGVLAAQVTAVDQQLLEADVLRTTVDSLRHGQLSTSLTLCHGILGTYDAAAMLPDAFAADRTDLLTRIGGYLSAARIRESLTSADVRYNLSPCVMVGTAGVAWHVLDRLGAKSVPSLLTLQGVDDA